MHSRLCVALFVVSIAVPAWAESNQPADGHDFLAEAKTLLVAGACADGPEYTAETDLVAAHCAKLKPAQDDYKKNWIALAEPFFKDHVPKDIPKIVVYPFAGGDLSTALTVYPDADEITTLSLEPAGDPRALARLDHKDLQRALATVNTELSSLYRANFSVTMNMINAMRGGALPTNLIFSLSALSLHGYEPTAMRYFRVEADGSLHYLTDADLAKIDKTVRGASALNRAFGDVEIRFHKVGSTREQVYRHIQANLDDKHLKATPGPLEYLEAKGQVAAMTKAASYLLTFDDFKTMRKYIIDHVVWMVSDTTGLAPKYGHPAGFEYETYGEYGTPNMAAGRDIAPDWHAEYGKQPARPLAFRFGYPDKALHGHLIIMRRPATPSK
jgi:hypothetical protein